jgi:hypothetical protein
VVGIGLAGISRLLEERLHYCLFKVSAGEYETLEEATREGPQVDAVIFRAQSDVSAKAARAAELWEDVSVIILDDSHDDFEHYPGNVTRCHPDALCQALDDVMAKPRRKTEPAASSALNLALGH